MSDLKDIPQYQSHKKVRALKIKTVSEPHLRGSLGQVAIKLTFDDHPAIECGQHMFARYFPKPGDYYVIYDDGYASFSPALAFEDGYTKIEK